MHGFSSGSILLVNAEVDSMGGVVEGGVGLCNRTSPRKAAIEKIHSELRLEYDVREERRRELEFLEEGGDPLEFKLGNTASLSVQSTSLTDQHPDQFVTSEAKGSFARIASPHGDSVESSGRPGAPPHGDPNSADNLMLFNGENEIPEVDRNLAVPTKSSFVPSEQSSQLDVRENDKELKDSAAFSLPRKAYRRRSRPNRDGARTGSTDAALTRGGNGASLASRHTMKEVKGFVSEAEIRKDQNVPLNCNSTPTSPNKGTIRKTLPSDDQLELDGLRITESTADVIQVLREGASDTNASRVLPDGQSINEKDLTELVLKDQERNCLKQDVDSADLECQPCVATTIVEDQANGFNSLKEDGKSLQIDIQDSSAAAGSKVLDSESSCTQSNLSLDGNDNNGMFMNLKNIDSKGNVKDRTLVPEVTSVKEENAELVKENKDQRNESAGRDVEDNSDHQNRQENGFLSGPEEELTRNTSGLENEVKDQIVVRRLESDAATELGSEKHHNLPSKEDSVTQSESTPMVTHQGSIESSIPKLTEPTPSARVPVAVMEGEDNNVKEDIKIKEDAILEEARIIEAKRKRIAELSVATFPLEHRRKSQWDYVLEEMTWLANDFAQERLWKMTAAAQLCHQVAFTSRLRFQEQNSLKEQRKVAHMLSKAVMEFWSSAQESSNRMVLTRRDSTFTIGDYAVRFLKFNSSGTLHNHAEAPVTPDRISDSGIMDMSWEDHWTEETLFYTIPSGATEAYRKIIESHVAQCEKIGSGLQEEVETSACDALKDFGSQENGDEDGETSMYDCDINKTTRFPLNKRKIFTKGQGVRTYEVGADLMYTQCMENKVVSQQSVLLGKRPANGLNVSIPTKRVRTACRQRILSPFTAGTSGCVQLPSKTDASSGDTSSFQDDQSTLNGGSIMPNSLEVESVGHFDKQLAFDSAEVSKPKKKKKAKHLVSAYDQRWQVDSNFHNEQRDHSKKRSESHQLESNGSSGLFGQHVSKKPKMMRPTVDSSFDNIAPVAGSVPSPVASQMSNMPNPNKLIKILGGRDRGRKAKASKVPPGQPGSGSPWSLFEDQALVVLVHDMGPNWELVSDAINSTLQFKCIYRKPKECNERHKILMDRNTGDGADSAEDSGSSQPYPSTLPGIPKGSARQLFQRLQGPMEEDTLKSHFEKIIMISQKQHYRKTQNDNIDLKQQQHHSSHMLALSQVCPNNLNGGPILTPLDLCDATMASSPDVLSLGYQSPHTNGVAMSNHGSVAPMLTASGVDPALQGSGNNFSSSSSSLNTSIRDGRCAVSRSASLSIDEQQRMQQYNQMYSGRNPQQPTLSAPGGISGTDRGMRMAPGGSMGVMGGVNRSVPAARPGFQAVASSSMLNSGSMISSGMVAIPSPAIMHPGPGVGQGNSVMRPRDALMMRPNLNQETQRQIMAPDIQMQVSQVNSQGIPAYGGLTSSFPNQAASPSVSSYPLHHQQHPVSSQQPHMQNPHHPHPHTHHQGTNHSSNAQHQAYAMRLAKERHLQQRFMQQQQQQQQQLAASNALLPHLQPQPQVPVLSPLPNSSQVQSQTSSPPVSFSPLSSSPSMTSMPQHSQKHQMPPHGLVRSSPAAGGGLTNQVGKQRRQPQQQQPQSQPQQFQQAGRHHPQQRQQSQSQQQNKLLKGAGRGNMVIQRNSSIDSSSVNGLSTNPGNQSTERGEQAMHSVQGQGLYPGSALNPVQNAKQLVSPNSSNLSQPQKKMYNSQVAQAAKHVQSMSSRSDHSSQPVPPSNHQLPQQHPQLQIHSHQKLANQNPPTSQRVPQHNRLIKSELASKLQDTESQIEQQGVSNISQTSISMPQADLSSPGVLRTPASEPIEGVGQKQSSGCVPPIEHEVSTQWQQPPKLQQPPGQEAQQQQHLSPEQLSQQQMPLVQAENNSLYVTPGDSRLD